MTINSQFLPIVIGTAGHVDHGKTSLIRHLTGSETDSSKEEQKRGLTITPGFSSYKLNNNQIVGVVDVPGHIDFIKNMISGATAQDILMLIIAADDSIMPQTKEHLQITTLLRKPQLIVVITKIDLVDKETLLVIHDDVQKFLKEFGYTNTPIIAISNHTQEGIDQLRQEIEKQVEITLAKRKKSSLFSLPFRMNIQRKFLIEGLGTVVTGIPVSGSLKNGSSIEILPSHNIGRIRGIQNYHISTLTTLDHACNGINIAGIDNNLIERGMTIVEPNSYLLSNRITVFLTNISNNPLQQGQLIRFYSGTSSVNAKLLLLSEKIDSNEKGFAQIILDSSLVLLAGDPFIIRLLSPSITIAGGKILSIQDIKFKRKKQDFLPSFKMAKDAIEQEDLLFSEILLYPFPIFNCLEIGKFVALSPSSIYEKTHSYIEQSLIIEIASPFFIIKNRIKEIIPKLIQFLNLYHAQNQLSLGASPKIIAQIFNLPSSCEQALCQILAKYLTNDFKFEKNYLSLINFFPKFSKNQLEQREKLRSFITNSEFKISPFGNVSKDLQIKPAELEFLIKIMNENQEITQIGNYLITYSQFQKLLQKIISFCQTSSNGIVLNHIREITGWSRNPSFTLLEYLLEQDILYKNGESHYLTSRYQEKQL